MDLVLYQERLVQPLIRGPTPLWEKGGEKLNEGENDLVYSKELQRRTVCAVPGINNVLLGQRGGLKRE